ncbi:oxidoreductase [Herbaspirillum sp. C9C3]|uniref:oxidoreductase n=1 Tax=Herbaspirillum sp. C9C3 TaxID=2735271 RepID=UPI0015856B08|nr:oxidoreductase [Herbaspirillum sp. C9C3]NUT62400.1 oxidoreductase [Herbaspirillum sp. C9C3]
MSKQNRIALVTGASSGIGEATAERFAALGYRVYGTSRRGKQASQGAFPFLRMDVTDDESVKNAIDEVLRQEGRIDVLVNNAGFGLGPAAAEESSLDQVRMLYETNVFGLIRVTNAVLPTMRKQGSGRILNVGSGLGIIPAPYNAHYSATKHAIEGYSESLDHEVREFGVRVLVIEPGVTRTSFDTSVTPPDRPHPAYDRSRQRYLVAYNTAMAAADSAESVAETIIQAAGAGSPSLRYPSGKVARQGAFARRFLPRAFLDKILHKQFGLG